MPPLSQEYNLLLFHPRFYTSNYFQIQRFRNGCQMQAESNRKEGWSLGGGGLTSLVFYKRTYLMGPSSFFCPPLFKKNKPYNATCLDLKLSNYFCSHDNSPIGPLDFLNLNSQTHKQIYMDLRSCRDQSPYKAGVLCKLTLPSAEIAWVEGGGKQVSIDPLL